jgi:hypothetical protein
MYIVAIAWLYVTLLVSITQPTVFRGIVTFVGVGLLPLLVLLYLLGAPQRRRNRERAAQSEPQAPDAPKQATAAPDIAADGAAPDPTRAAAVSDPYRSR